MDTFILSNNEFMREGLVTGLREDGRVDVVGSAASLDHARGLLHSLLPTTVLIDLQVRQAKRVIRSLGTHLPETRVVVFDMTGRREDFFAAVEAGVAGYLSRDASIDDVVAALCEAGQNRFTCSRRVAADLFDHVRSVANGAQARAAHASVLTPREIEIGALLVRGLANKEIARTLGIQVATVKNHVHNVLGKLGARSRGEAAAILNGAVDDQGYRGEALLQPTSRRERSY